MSISSPPYGPSKLTRLMLYFYLSNEAFQPRVKVPWGEINKRILEAPCNTLTILDCENADLAALIPNSRDLPKGFQKELIVARNWGDKIDHHMSQSLAKALTKTAPQLKTLGGKISVSALVRLMNESSRVDDEHGGNAERRASQRVNVPQAVHHVLADPDLPPLVLQRHVRVPL